MDLPTYLQRYEPDELVRNGANEYCTKTHDSLKISKGLWIWNKHRIDGRSALDYLVKVRLMGFVEAVEHLPGLCPDLRICLAEMVVHGIHFARHRARQHAARGQEALLESPLTRFILYGSFTILQSAPRMSVPFVRRRPECRRR